MDIFKYALVRIGGDSISKLDSLIPKYDSIEKEIACLNNLKQQKNEIVDTLCNTLHFQISLIKEPLTRKILLNLKRDLFNNRYESKIHKYESTIQLLDEEILTQFLVIQNLAVKINEATFLIETKYADLILSEKKIIFNFCKNEKFLKGILLSSEFLFRYAKEKSPDFSIRFTSEDIGLWKYLTRMVTKTSPFSTLTNLSIGTFVTKQRLIDFSQPFEEEVTSVVLYNNNIFSKLINILLKNSLVNILLPIRLNTTLRVLDGELSFLTNYNNIEAFQRIKQNDTLNKIIEVTSQNQNISYGNLKKLLVLEGMPSTNALDNYISELVKTGLLEIGLEMPILREPWDLILKQLLYKYYINNDSYPTVMSYIERIIAMRFDYQNANATDRDLLLTKMHETIEEFMHLLHSDAGLPQTERLENQASKQRKPIIDQFKYIKPLFSEKKIILLHLDQTNPYCNKKNIIFEDTYVNKKIIIDQRTINLFIEKLSIFIKAFSFLPSSNDEHDNFLSFFKEHCSGNIDFLNFYEKYYRHREKEKSKSGLNSHSSQSKYSLDNFIKYNSDLLILKQEINKNQSNDCLNIPLAVLESMASTSSSSEFKNQSYGAIVQFYIDDEFNSDKLIGVVNGISVGHGKFISRFLKLFDQRVTEELTQWNILNAGDDLFCEINDSSIFNANIHSPLFPFEIVFPGSYNRLGQHNQINIRDIIIKYNSQNECLELYNGERKIYAFNSGFQRIASRSKAYQMLNTIAGNRNFKMSEVLRILNGMTSHDLRHKYMHLTNQAVLFLPRIYIDDSIIIQRMCWIIPSSIVLTMLKNETDLLSFSRIQQWRHSLQMPNEIFLRLNWEPEKNSINKKEKKPQYVNFLSPICVKLFIKMFESGATTIIIEEMLPNSKQMLTCRDQKYATEYLLQWKNKQQ